MGCCFCNCCFRRLGGIWNDPTIAYAKETGLSTKAVSMVYDSFDGLDVTQIVDGHVHLLGIHQQESGCYVHENMDKCCKCTSFAKKRILLQASGFDMDNIQKSDKPYYQRLVSLFEHFIPIDIQNKAKEKIKKAMKLNINNDNDNDIDDDENKEEKTALINNNNYGTFNNDWLNKAICPKAVLLGLDQVYNKDTGDPEPNNTSVYCPPSYVHQIQKEYQHIFVLGPSIHPYRNDCIQKLEEFKNAGCNIVKWLPNSMCIDPMDAKCDPFYDKLVELDMFLLTHTGQEHSLDDANYTFQEFGNPLRYRRALKKGCKLIMAHCASEGSDEDLDGGKNDNNHSHVNSCDLFIRLMREKKYVGQLYGDISALTAFKRVSALKKILQCKDIHNRLIYGSDYPVPCINAVVWYGRLVSNELITNDQAELLREIFKYNPILADFVVKRILRFKDSNNTIHKFSDKIFQQYPLFATKNNVNLNIKDKKDQ